MFTIRAIMRLLLVCALMAAPSFGQLTRGFISGVVQDPSGSVVPDVLVKITNQATNLSSETSTNAAGIYRLVAVEPGTYTVEFSRQGFETRRIPNIAVTGNQEVTLNQSLTVAATTTTIEVVEAPPGVELSKTSATIERKLGQQFIADVALTGNTRDVNTLALLAPTTNRAPGSTGIAANGQRARNNNFLLDGADNNDLSVTLVSNRVIPEAVAEFQVQTQAYSAEFSRNSGARSR